MGLVAYTITHHTRQSAIGLPEIVKRNYGGKGMMVTDYTMSEIVASVYDCMENTGRKEGILFIDEINCVSEILAPREIHRNIINLSGNLILSHSTVSVSLQLSLTAISG